MGSIPQGSKFLLPLLAFALTGCPSNTGGTGGGAGGGAGGAGGSTTGNGTIGDLTASATAGTTFTLPLDAALSPDGKTAYFIALSNTGEPALFKANAPSTEAPAQLHMGTPLAAPFGLDVTSDGSALIVSDPGVEDPASDDRGVVFTAPVAGGGPTAIAGTAGYQPRGIVVVVEGTTDQIYFTGKDKADGQPGVFKTALAGGAVTVVAKGAPFVDPSGIAVASNGTVYVADTSGSAESFAAIVKVVGTAATIALADLKVGYPAGIALSKDESTLLISALDKATGTDAVIRFSVAGGMPEYVVAGGIDAFSESAGLKRARNVDTYIWADSAANNGGTVFVINKQP
jgi:hypothetical protein